MNRTKGLLYGLFFYGMAGFSYYMNQESVDVWIAGGQADLIHVAPPFIWLTIATVFGFFVLLKKKR